jgi:hypothetical protein
MFEKQRSTNIKCLRTYAGIKLLYIAVVKGVHEVKALERCHCCCVNRLICLSSNANFCVMLSSEGNQLLCVEGVYV